MKFCNDISKICLRNNNYYSFSEIPQSQLKSQKRNNYFNLKNVGKKGQIEANDKIFSIKT